MYATNFSFANETLYDYGCMICSFDSSSGVTISSSGSDISFTKVSVPKNYKFKFVDSRYEDTYTTTFQICKRDICENPYFNSYEEAKMQRWLSRKETHKFKLDQEEYYDCYFMGTFSVKKVLVNGKTAGFELTFVADAPFGYKEFDEITATISGDNKIFTVYDMSDEIGILYPKITVKVEEDGDLTIENSMDNLVLSLKSCQSGEIITLDSENGTIMSNFRTSSDLGANGVFNFNFPRVINTYDEQENVYTFSLGCEITFTYTPIKKVGF